MRNDRQQYGSGRREGEYGGYAGYNLGGQGGYGTGAGQGGQLGGYQRGSSDAHHGAWSEQMRRRYGNEDPSGFAGSAESGAWDRGSYQESRQRITPKGYTRSDERMHEDICEHLSRSALDVSDVSVEVAKGHVILEGTVKDRQTKHAIENCADDCMGVQDIDNRIRVQRVAQP